MRRFLLYSVFLICVVCASIVSVFAGVEYANFENYTTKDGLISNKILFVDQDSSGFLWIATDYGLERFDGSRFKHFQTSQYPEMVRDDIFWVQHLGSDRISIGGYNGLILEYDRLRDVFINKKPDDFDNSYYKEARGIVQGADGEQYLYTVGGVYVYDELRGVFSDGFPAYKSLQYVYVKTMLIDKFGNFWVGSVDNVSVIDKRGKTVARYDIPYFVSSIFLVDDNTVAISFWSDDLWVFDIENGNINNQTKLKVPFKNTTMTIKDSGGDFWFSTDGYGLWHTSNSSFSAESFNNVVLYNYDKDALSKIYSVTEDKKGNIWLGTQKSGLWKCVREKKSGVCFSSDFGFPSAVCTSFAEDSLGRIWVSTDGNGVFVVSDSVSKIENISVGNNNVVSLCNSGGGDVLAGTWGGGLCNVNIYSYSVKKERFAGIENPVNCFFGVNEMTDGSLWACTTGDGLYKKDCGEKWNSLVLKDDSLSIYPNTWVFSALDGGAGVRWVITTNTLWRIENDVCTALLPDISTIKTHKPLVLTDMEVDNDGNLYVTSNQGVYFFSADGKKNKVLDYVPVSFYKIIVRDDDGVFWVAGTDGVRLIDVREKSVRVLSLGGDKNRYDFYNRAGFKDSKGRVYLGTNGGYFVFDKKKGMKKDEAPYLAFSDFFLSGKKISPFSGVLSSGCLNGIDVIELEHDQTDVSIGFDVIDFSLFNSVQCSFRLCGFNDEWTNLGGDRSVVYRHIPPGDYLLEIMAYRADVGGDRAIISKRIVVHSPWWEAFWFKFLVGLALICLTAFIFWIRTRRLREMQNILKEKVQEKTMSLNAALNEKDRIISVIAHDLKNPMFAIVGSLDIIKADDSVDARKIVDGIYDSAKTLQNELVALLEWAKSRSDEENCNFSDVNLNEAVMNVVSLLRANIEKKNISFQTQFELMNFAYGDYRMLSAVIRNLITNAIKFTRNGGLVDVHTFQQNGEAYVSVRDNGVGIKPEVLELIKSGDGFTSLGTDDEAGVGLGIQLCIHYIEKNNGKISFSSKEGEGTEIVVSLPMSEKLLSDEMSNVEDKIMQFEVPVDLFSGNTVLVVDDDAQICRNIKFVLGKYMNVVTAYDGQQALEKVNDVLPDIILTDVEMPRMNGIELSKALMQNERTSAIPVLFVSAKNEESDRLLGLLNGAVDYISKPFSHTELFIKLTNILKLRQKTQNVSVSMYLAGKADADKNESRINPFLIKLFDVLDKRYSESDLSVDDVAADMSVSLSTLSRRLKSLTDKTPLEMITEYRLNVALRKLKDREPGESVSDIAYMVGFNDAAYFTRKFRSFFGYPPSQVKK